MNKILLLSGAGVVGTLLRYFAASFFFSEIETTIPWGTFFINIFGAFLMGFFVESFNTVSLSDTTRIALTFGFLGAFTTYSAYAWEVVALFRYGYMWRAVMYMFLTNIISCLLLCVGIFFARFIFSR